MATKSVNLSKLTNEQLHTFHKNALRLGSHELAERIVRELYWRGKAKRAQLSTLRWNEPAIAELLQPFAQVARTILQNRRTAYTNGGGLRRKPKVDPNRMMVDSYSAMKRGKINAAIAGRVKEPGAEPSFELLVNGHRRLFELPELEEALVEWRNLAAAA